MGRGKTVSFLRGKRVRATKLNASGAPLVGDSSVVVSKGFITIGMTTNTEDGEAISQTNANGESCILETAVPSFTGVGVEIEFCGVDFGLFEMVTGQPAVLDDNGIVVGITESTDVNLGAVNFALEMWLGATTDAAPATGSQGQFGYVLLPRLGGGVISDISVENGAINFTLTGMSTKNGSLWGVGPYKVDLTAGVPSTLRRAIKANDHRRIQIVEVAPPAVYSGALPLLDPAAPAVTSITATVTGKVASIAPTPAGTDPMWYDFGDGTWDYAATGSYSHTYAVAGTYTITAYRGSSSVVKTGVIVT
jgi:hypothetical protein